MTRTTKAKPDRNLRHIWEARFDDETGALTTKRFPMRQSPAGHWMEEGGDVRSYVRCAQDKDPNFAWDEKTAVQNMLCLERSMHDDLLESLNKLQAEVRRAKKRMEKVEAEASAIWLGETRLQGAS